ncbi:putative methyltransferase-domain-containing protein [Cubamyces lactineus]|nr:putative methyltransferase-domain-containing protein [Cubamyces lactineus]
MLDLALEEHLDELDPLRHFRDDASDEDSANTIVPVQPPSIRNQTIELVFPAPGDRGAPIAIRLAVDASPGCGGIAWPAGEVLASYISRRGSLDGKTVLELGSGTGLVGLVAGKLGARVWITDQAPLLGIMKQNVSLNGLESCVSVMELNWGAPIPANLPRPDLILAADCVYFEPAFPLLVKTLADLVKDSSTEVLFCYKKRRKADKRFFNLLKKEFTWEEVSDDPQREVYSKEAISLLRLFRR